jgi:hypothetical protein
MSNIDHMLWYLTLFQQLVSNILWWTW